MKGDATLLGFVLLYLKEAASFLLIVHKISVEDQNPG